MVKDTVAPVGVLNSPPPAVNSLTTIASSVNVSDTLEYSYKVGAAASVNCALATGYSASTAIATAITGTLVGGSNTYKLCVVGKNAANA